MSHSLRTVGSLGRIFDCFVDGRRHEVKLVRRHTVEVTLGCCRTVTEGLQTCECKLGGIESTIRPVLRSYKRGREKEY